MTNVRSVLTTASLLVSLAGGAAVAQTAPGQAAPAKAAAPAGPQVHSAAEGQALRAIVTSMRNPAMSPKAMDDQLTGFATKFPTSDYMNTVNTIAVEFFHAHQDYPRTLQYGENALKKDPDSLFILLTLGSDIPANVKETDLDKDQRLAEATGYNEHALKIVANMPAVFNGRPLNPAERDGIVKMVTSSAHSNLAMIEMVRKNYAGAVKEYQTALPMDGPAAAAMDYYHLGLAQESMKDYPGATASLDKAISMGAQNASLVEMAKVEKQKIARESAQK